MKKDNKFTLIKEFEETINENYKKENGIFYTDEHIVNLMFSEINMDKNSYILDPCCGAGAFIVGAKQFKYENICGIDSDIKAVKKCREITGFENIIQYDSIFNTSEKILKKLNLTQKPDLIIGNPPYVPSSKILDINVSQREQLKYKMCGNLFVGAIYKALDLVKQNGIISYIIPKNFLHVNLYKDIRNEILHCTKIISIIDIGAYFKQVRGEQIILTLKKCKPDLDVDKVIFKKYENKNLVNLFEMKQSYYSDKIIIFKDEEDFNIYNKFMSSYKTMGDFCKGFVGRGTSNSKEAIKGKDIGKFMLKEKKIPTKGKKIFIQNIYSAEAGIIGCFAGNLEATETVTVLTDTNADTCRFLLGVLHSRLCNYYLYKYCYNSSKLTMHTDAKYLLQIPIVDNFREEVVYLVKQLEKTSYLSNKWHEIFEELNELVYKIYEINDNEKEYIEKQIKQIQSKRWVNDYGKKAANE